MRNLPEQTIKILVIEDEPGDFMLVKVYLREAGLAPLACSDTLVWATTLKEGLAATRLSPPDVVLLDLSLPDSSGLITVQTLRANLPDVPIVVLTGNDEKSLALATLESGAQDYLIKGQFDSDALGRAVRHACIRERLEQKLARANRLYAALSQCNQAIVRCTNEEDLLLQVCRIAVNYGNMKMAWIGLTDPLTHKLRVATSFGLGSEYLQDLAIPDQPDCTLADDPTGTAIRENRAVWCHDFIHDPLTCAWHERAASLGWGAMAALPLNRSHAVCGVFNVYLDASSVFDEASQALLLEMSTDISFALTNFVKEAERKQAHAILSQERDFTQAALDSLPGLFYLIDEQGKFLRWNRNFLEVSGYDNQQIAQMSPLDFFGESDQLVIAEAIQKIYAQGAALVEADFLAKNRTCTPFLFSGKRFLYGEKLCLMGMAIDITQNKQANERIQWMSHFDSLTGLANQSLLKDRFVHALSMAQRSNKSLTLMTLDLDHFKNINDTLGRYIGDAMLVEIARRIQSVVNEVDTVSRQGGDEFILLLPTTDASGAAHLAEKLLGSIATNYQVEAHELVITPSIGIALFPADGCDFDALSKNSEVAMYRAKQDGRNCYRFYASEMQTRSTRTLQLESALRRALERKQLTLHYQPQVSLKNGSIIGTEALLRWQHPEFGMVSPAEFIPIAEASGQIVQLGEWVLRTAVRQMKNWLLAGLSPDNAPLIIAVNLSVVQFRHPKLIEQVMQILAEENLPPQYLELELTEGVALSDPIGAISVINQLHENGIRMSIDDFGTGYSSLSYLKRFKVYKLKIDQSFVRDISCDPEDKAIVSAVISMAKSLGLQTIAEGVETDGQLAFLRESGCDEVQGYYFSKPLPAVACEVFLRQAQASSCK